MTAFLDMRALAVLFCMWSLSACWPGRCAGGLRGLLPIAEKGQSIAELDREHPYLSINLDTNLKTGSEIVAASQLSSSSVRLEGPTGMVPLTVQAFVYTSAHSCAGAGSLRVTPTAALVPGDYTFIVLLDQVKWPAIDDDDITSWRGKRAMVRRIRVR